MDSWTRLMSDGEVTMGVVGIGIIFAIYCVCMSNNLMFTSGSISEKLSRARVRFTNFYGGVKIDKMKRRAGNF